MFSFSVIISTIYDFLLTSSFWMRLVAAAVLLLCGVGVYVISIRHQATSGVAAGSGNVMPESVNYHFTRQCNYSCGFCFHTAKTKFLLPIEDAKRGLKLLKDAGDVAVICLCVCALCICVCTAHAPVSFNFRFFVCTTNLASFHLCHFHRIFQSLNLILLKISNRIVKML